MLLCRQARSPKCSAALRRRAGRAADLAALRPELFACAGSEQGQMLMRSITLLVSAVSAAAPLSRMCSTGAELILSCAGGSLLLKSSAGAAGHVRGTAALAVMHLTDRLRGCSPVTIGRGCTRWLSRLAMLSGYSVQRYNASMGLPASASIHTQERWPQGGPCLQAGGEWADLRQLCWRDIWRQMPCAQEVDQPRTLSASPSDERDMMIADGLNHAACVMRTTALCKGLEKWMLCPGDLRSARKGEGPWRTSEDQLSVHMQPQHQTYTRTKFSKPVDLDVAAIGLDAPQGPYLLLQICRAGSDRQAGRQAGWGATQEKKCDADDRTRCQQCFWPLS